MVQTLVRWATRVPTDRMLDPSCGDGRFLAAWRNSFGVERDSSAHAQARQRAPWARIHEGEFFTWAATTKERFECAAGNPPFIRYQTFAGPTRERALKLAASLGAPFSALTSSWAPFLVATASLLKRGGRMAFVIPSEVGHAPYAEPLLTFLASSFARVQLVAVREKVFPELSEDVWLLFADGYGDRTAEFEFTATDHLKFIATPPRPTSRVSDAEWRRWNRRLRPFLLPESVRELYLETAALKTTRRFGTLAKIGIGYVTGDNDFFHLRPSQAKAARIPRSLLRPTVRNGRALNGHPISDATVRRWLEDDEQILLLHLTARTAISDSLKKYLNSDAARAAQKTYKCRNRSPWYAVPDVKVPDAFLSYMSSEGPALVANHSGCVATNSVHTVNVTNDWSLSKLLLTWKDPFTRLSCEIEGHPLGGGALKVEPGEAVRVALIDKRKWSLPEQHTIADGINTLRRWRHCRG